MADMFRIGTYVRETGVAAMGLGFVPSPRNSLLRFSDLRSLLECVVELVVCEPERPPLISGQMLLLLSAFCLRFLFRTDSVVFFKTLVSIFDRLRKLLPGAVSQNRCALFSTIRMRDSQRRTCGALSLYSPPEGVE